MTLAHTVTSPTDRKRIFRALPEALDELTTLLRAIVRTQAELVEAIADVTDDVADLSRRVEVLESSRVDAAV